MKASPTRIIRRRKRTSADSAFFKKESQEPGFFADATHETFFQPEANSIQRKCPGCEEEEKVQRATDKKEDEKKLQRSPEKKDEEKELQKKDKSIKDEEKKVQRSREKKDEEKKLQKKGDAIKDEDEKIQRITDKKEDEKKKIQRKESGGNLTAPAATASYVSTLNGKGTSLPQESRNFFGIRMGYDFSHVKVHTGPEAERSAKEVNAKAYTIRNHIVFNTGQFDTDSNQGKKLLAHELVHVVQKEKTNASNGSAAEHLNNIGYEGSIE